MCPLAFSSYLQAPVPFIIGEGVGRRRKGKRGGKERGRGKEGGVRRKEGGREDSHMQSRGVTHTHTHTHTQVSTASILTCLRSRWRCVW